MTLYIVRHVDREIHCETREEVLRTVLRVEKLTGEVPFVQTVENVPSREGGGEPTKK